MTEQGQHILLVEDERKLARLIERQLLRAQYLVELAFDGQAALDSLTNHEIDLVVLDINLPRISGFDVLDELRRNGKNIPVLILSGRTGIDDRIKGLNLGADDFLVKPFDSAELLARIQAILRRSGVIRTSILRSSDLILDVVKHTVTRAGKELSLTQRELTLLEFFLRNKNQILTRKRIAQEVWGYTFETGTNIIDVYVSYLRRVIDDGFEIKLIQTVYGQGFILREP